MKRILSSRFVGIGAIALFALALAGIGATAVAQGPGCQMKAMQAPTAADAPRAPMKLMVTDAKMPGGPMGGRGCGPMLDRLDLSDQQREAIGKIREDGKTAGLPLRKEMMRARNELRGEMLKDEPAAQRVREIAKRIGDLKTELQLQGIDQRLAIRKLLTPEQRDQMLAMGPGFDPEGDDDEARGPGRCGGMGGPRGDAMMCMPGGGACSPMMCMPGGGGEGGAMMCMPGAGGEGGAMMCMPGGGCSMMSQGGPDFQVMPEGGWGQSGVMMCMPGGGGEGGAMMCMPGGGMTMPQGGCGHGGAMMCSPGGGGGQGGRATMKACHGGRGCNADDGAKCGKGGRGDKHDKRDKDDDEEEDDD
jgi:Spy/CpxP family protein refolding chaperone